MLNFVGLGFSFAMRGAAAVVKGVKAVGGATWNAVKFMGKLSGAAQSAAGIIGVGLGGAVSLLIGSFKILKASVSAVGAIIGGAFSLAKLGAGAFMSVLEGINGLGPSISKTFFGALEGLGDNFDLLAGKGRNLTSGLEQEMMNNAKDARAMGAQWGYAGDKLDDFVKRSSGIPRAINASVDEAAKAVRAFDEVGSGLQALGLETPEMLVRFSRAYAVNTDDMREQLASLQGMNVSAGAVDRVYGSVFKMGQLIGGVPEAMASLNQIVPMFRQNRALIQGMGEEDLVKFTESLSLATVALSKSGVKASESQETIMGLAESMQKARTGLHDMFAGSANELPQELTSLSLITGDVNQAMKLMQEGPSGLLAGFANIYQGLRTQGEKGAQALNFVRTKLVDVVGEQGYGQLVQAVQSMTPDAIKSLQQMEGAATNVTAEFGKAAREADKIGRTSNEVYEMLLETVENTTRRMGKKGANAWLGTARENLKELNKDLGAMVGGKGGLGAFLSKLSETNQLGMAAFVPAAMQGTFTELEALNKAFGPAIKHIGDFATKFTSLTGIMELGATGLAAWGYAAERSRTKGESFGDAMVRVGNEWVTSLGDSILKAQGWILNITDIFATTDWNSVFGGGEKGGAKEGVGSLFDNLTKAFGIDNGKWEQIWENFSTGVKRLWAVLWTDENKQKLDEALTTVGAWLRDGLFKIVDTIDWVDLMSKITVGMLKGAAGILGNLGDYIGNLWFDAFGSDDNAFYDKNNKLGMTAPKKKKKESPLMSMLPVKDIQQQSVQIQSSLNDIMSTVDENHSASMNTLIGNDMIKATGIVAKQSELIISAFDNIGLSGEDIFARMWHGVETNTATAIDRISDLARGLVSQLENLAIVESQLTDVGKRESLFATPAANEARDAELRALKGDAAIHEPYWYAGSGGYRELFESRMDRLIAAVESMRFGAPSPAATAAAGGSIGGPPSRVKTGPARSASGGRTR